VQNNDYIGDRTEVKTVDEQVIIALDLLGDLKIVVAETEKQY
jgi:hypothetical protein